MLGYNILIFRSHHSAECAPMESAVLHMQAPSSHFQLVGIYSKILLLFVRSLLSHSSGYTVSDIVCICKVPATKSM